MRVYTFTPLKIWYRKYYVEYAFVMCSDYYRQCVSYIMFEIYDNIV